MPRQQLIADTKLRMEATRKRWRNILANREVVIEGRPKESANFRVAVTGVIFAETLSFSGWPIQQARWFRIGDELLEPPNTKDTMYGVQEKQPLVCMIVTLWKTVPCKDREL